ncbi:C39 family peptidase [Lysinibacillus cavernae]|uniref:C39 family peptidase n=1 Tax=Lysinibacillus cavernae TaxID=2666135 RepID=UPI0012D9AB74|nr:C39 family peptidase [Lysinibacillus cavernae]
MRQQLALRGKSQYDPSIAPSYRHSACGPTTIHVILNYLNDSVPSINELYKQLGGTKIGLFKWRLIRNLRRLQPTWDIRTCSLKEALQEIDAGRPVAIRFDRYFSLRWRDKKSTFAYHWVPLIGYDIKNDELWLVFHDNGGPNRDSTIRHALYKDNEKVLSFVKMTPP